jgi:hypothetical protein
VKSQRAYVEHVIECIRRIGEDSASGRTAVSLRELSRTQSFGTFKCSASRRQRIGEAHKQRHPEINWPSIAGLRNVLVHDHFEVDFETVWLVVTRDLPPLEKAMRAIMAVLDHQPDWKASFVWEQFGQMLTGRQGIAQGSPIAGTDRSETPYNKVHTFS